MRLTPDLISSSLSYLNPLKERELDLRGHKIPLIENLAVAGPHDSIDFTDNDIAALSNFPLSPRLSTLLLARNRVTQIQSNLAESVPNLKCLVLSENGVRELADLDALRKFTKLTHLSLAGNPVTRKEKIKDSDREHATGLFGTYLEPSTLASKVMGIKSKTFGVGNAMNDRAAPEKGVRIRLTDSEKKRVQEMIKNAKSMQEITRIEKDLTDGRIPAGCADSDRMEM